jgi:AcrR family transcriptional regulator
MDKKNDMTRTIKHPNIRRLEIVKAARHLFQAKSYDKTTIQDVIDHLGIAKGTIYHYFKSRQELLGAVIKDIVDENVEQMQSIVAESSGNALDKMRQLFPARKMLENHWGFRLIVSSG